ncbi:MAG TPA: hypothetical protein VGM67_12415 [Gemmatimonadaceae bacterium]|jgi:hypothetical protein
MPWVNLFFGTTRAHFILLFSAAGSFALVTGFIGAWIGARFAARAAARTVLVEADMQRASGSDQAEFRQLTQSIDAIAIEVERIAEAQRFMARVLVERPDQRMASVVRRDSGNATPH